MWDMLCDLRPYGARFRGETPVGPYIADFAWLSARLIIDVDGDSHETAEGRRHDLRRDAFMKTEGFTVLRFDDGQVVDGPDYIFVTIQAHAMPFLRMQPQDEASATQEDCHP
jgi:very-short-patch-repair endonuclease